MVHPGLLIHYHIFKNAGSSFEWALEQALGNGFRAFDTGSPRGFISANDLAEFCAQHPETRAVSSHQAAPPAPRIPGREVLSSILVRDPIARIGSIYAFERRQQAETPGALKAKELSFEEYVEWRLRSTPALLCNYQVYFCSRTADKRKPVPGEEELELAIANLDTISIVGTVERYKEWLTLAERMLSDLFGGVSLMAARKNVTGKGDPSHATILEELIGELGDERTQYLVEQNQLDMRLHQIADALLSRKLAQYGLGSTPLYHSYTSARKGMMVAARTTDNS